MKHSSRPVSFKYAKSWPMLQLLPAAASVCKGGYSIFHIAWLSCLVGVGFNVILSGKCFLMPTTQLKIFHMSLLFSALHSVYFFPRTYHNPYDIVLFSHCLCLLVFLSFLSCPSFLTFFSLYIFVMHC